MHLYKVAVQKELTHPHIKWDKQIMKANDEQKVIIYWTLAKTIYAGFVQDFEQKNH